MHDPEPTITINRRDAWLTLLLLTGALLAHGHGHPTIQGAGTITTWTTLPWLLARDARRAARWARRTLNPPWNTHR